MKERKTHGSVAVLRREPDRLPSPRGLRDDGEVIGAEGEEVLSRVREVHALGLCGVHVAANKKKRKREEDQGLLRQGVVRKAEASPCQMRF